MIAATITVQQLIDALDYNENTGRFVWKQRPREQFRTDRGHSIFNSQFAGAEAFTTIGVNGYRMTRFMGAGLLAHRVAWAITTGCWPKKQIDHIDGDRTNNAILNLREADQSTQNRNAAMPYRNKSGRIGVSYDRRRGKWVAQTRLLGRQINLGRFDTFEQASAARARMEAENGFHPNHGRARFSAK